MTFNDFSNRLITLESVREQYLNEKHPEWADAAFDSARNILRDVYHFNADHYEMLVYIWGIINEVINVERWHVTFPTQEEEMK